MCRGMRRIGTAGHMTKTIRANSLST